MEKLLALLNSLSKAERADFVTSCKTTEGYLRKAISIRQRISAELCIHIERASGALVTCEDLRPDIDWAYLRSAPLQPPAE